MPNQFPDIKLETLKSIFHLSSRTIDFCLQNDLISLDAILYQFTKDSEFEIVGRDETLVKRQLISICKYYEDSLSIEFIKPEKDSPLEELIFRFKLSNRTVNVCNQNDLVSLFKIFDYFLNNRNFKRIRNCGIKTQVELLNICTQHHIGILDLDPKYQLINLSHDLNLADIYDRHNLTDEAIRCLGYLKIKSLSGLLKYYVDNRTFINDGYPDEKVNVELKDVCEYYTRTGDSNLINYDYIGVLEKIASFTPFQKSLLIKHFEYLLNHLSVRSFNGIGSISSTNNPYEVFNIIFRLGFDFGSVKNVGEKSINELKKFRSDLVSMVYVLLELPQQQLKKEYLKLVLQTTFKNISIQFFTDFDELFDESERIKLFTLLNRLIYSSILFNNTMLKFFDMIYTAKGTDKLTIASIASELNLTKERVRQLKVAFEESSSTHLMFLPNLFGDEDLLNYGIDSKEGFMYISEEIIRGINLREHVDFNIKFYGLVFGLLLNKTHVELGYNQMFNGGTRVVGKKEYSNCYFVEKEMYACFDFDKFVDDIYAKLNERVTETYSLKLLGYIEDFVIDSSVVKYEDLISICEIILYHEFSLVVDVDGYINIERNTRRQNYEYCLEILKEATEPMTVEQIALIVNERWPDMRLSTESLRTSLQREKMYFIYFGRSSTYGLKEWEENSNIKGGTIRDIVEEFLESQDEPKHISEILEYVIQYRPNTNEKNVLTNLKIGENKRFIFFNGEFVGLPKKKYREDYFQFRKLAASHFRQKVFENLGFRDIDEVIRYFVDNYGYNQIQVKSIIDRKISRGELKVTNGKIFQP